MVGRLFGQMDLSLFNKDIIEFTSCASVSVVNNDSSLGWLRKSWNDSGFKLDFQKWSAKI